MKKSFKKAGAAVLSMAMLLSMGAMSLPVYAAPVSNATAVADQGTNAGMPAQVTVHVTGLDTNAYHQGEGQSAADNKMGDGADSEATTKWPNSKQSRQGTTYQEKYDYLTLGNGDFFNTVEDANVTMYRIARLDNGKGWDWEDYVKAEINGEQIPGFTDFASLLANRNGTTAESDKSDITGEFEFKTESSKLQEMASYFERLITKMEKKLADAEEAMGGYSQANYEAASPAQQAAYNSAKAALDAIKVGSGNLNPNNASSGVTITDITPANLDLNHDGVVDDDEAVLTQNVIGYYIIVTETEQSGVIVQPVLLCLKNGEHKNVSVKGSTIKFEKTMIEIEDKDGNSKGDTSAATDTFNSTASSNLKNGLVAQNDVVKYEIKSQLPKYDPNVKQQDITDFVISDMASTGITITAPVTSGESGKAATNIDATKFKVYLAETSDDLDDAEKRWELTGNNLPNVGDYQLVMKTGNHGFDLKITGFQMVQEDSRFNTNGTSYMEGTPEESKDKKPDQVKYIIGDNGSSRDNEDLSQATKYQAANKIDAENMYNLYIKVEFEATVNKKADGTDITDESQLAFDRTYDEFIDVADIKAADITALGDATSIAKQVARVKLFGGETMYNQTYDESLWKYSDAETPVAPATFSSLSSDELDAIAAELVTAGYAGVTRTELMANDNDGEFFRIVALLARDKKNITMNGEYNTAEMTYGNKYATGGGDVKMTTNYSKVYSVGLKLSKFIETLQVQGITTIADDNATGWEAFWNRVKDTEVSIPWTTSTPEATGTWTGKLADLEATVDEDSDAGKMLASTLSSSSVPETVTSGSTTIDGLNDNQQKALAYLVAQNNATAGTNGTYIADENSKKPVEGAVFHLARIDTASHDGVGEATVLEDLGYAVSTDKGKLYKLTVDKTTSYESEAAAEAAIVAAASTHTDEVGVSFKDGDAWYVGYVKGSKNAAGVITYTGTDVTNGNDETWDMLDIGYYEIQELKVPVGFKKWDIARFQIAAETDDGTYLQDGAWTGAYNAHALISAQPNATASSGLASIAETKVGVANFNYYTDKTTHEYTTDTAHSDGVLQKDMYNEYLDELPATGGMGTVLFTAGGIAVILMAGALFVVYMKKRNAEEEE